MLNKYNQLLDMLRLKGYNVSEFECMSEQNAIISNNIDNYIDILLLENEIEIYLYNIDIEEHQEIKTYKNIKSAYNYIIKHLED